MVREETEMVTEPSREAVVSIFARSGPRLASRLMQRRHRKTLTKLLPPGKGGLTGTVILLLQGERGDVLFVCVHETSIAGLTRGQTKIKRLPGTRLKKC